MPDTGPGLFGLVTLDGRELFNGGPGVADLGGRRKIRRAELEHRSMQEVARQAIREYVENHSRAELLDHVLERTSQVHRGSGAARPVIFLTLPELLHIAERTLGPDYAVRDYGLLEAALARPQATAFGKDAYPDLDAKAAALLRGLNSNRRLFLQLQCQCKR